MRRKLTWITSEVPWLSMVHVHTSQTIELHSLNVAMILSVIVIVWWNGDQVCILNDMDSKLWLIKLRKVLACFASQNLSCSQFTSWRVHGKDSLTHSQGWDFHVEYNLKDIFGHLFGVVSHSRKHNLHFSIGIFLVVLLLNVFNDLSKDFSEFIKLCSFFLEKSFWHSSRFAKWLSDERPLTLGKLKLWRLEIKWQYLLS